MLKPVHSLASSTAIRSDEPVTATSVGHQSEHEPGVLYDWKRKLKPVHPADEAILDPSPGSIDSDSDQKPIQSSRSMLKPVHSLASSTAIRSDEPVTATSVGHQSEHEPGVLYDWKRKLKPVHPADEAILDPSPGSIDSDSDQKPRQSSRSMLKPVHSLASSTAIRSDEPVTATSVGHHAEHEPGVLCDWKRKLKPVHPAVEAKTVTCYSPLSEQTSPAMAEKPPVTTKPASLRKTFVPTLLTKVLPNSKT